jgi:solute carrier family 35, member F5
MELPSNTVDHRSGLLRATMADEEDDKPILAAEGISQEAALGVTIDERTKLVRQSALPNSAISRSTKCRRLIEGIFLLVLVAVIWVAAAALAQNLLKDRNLPVFLTWVNVSMFAGLLPFRWARERWTCLFVPAAAGEKAKRACTLKQAARSDWKAAAKAGAIVAIPWFLAQGSYNASLSATSVSSSTVLSTTSCVFTFGLSLLFLKEPFRWMKLFGVFITLGGAVMVAYSDRSNHSGTDKWWGDALALFSAVCYAFYTLLIKKLVPDEDDQAAPSPEANNTAASTPPPRISMQVFFGFLGVANAVLLAPVVGVLQGLGVEDQAKGLPLSFIGLMLLKGLFDNVISDLLWARAIQLTSPTIATVGLSLTIPLAMTSDLIFKGKVPPGLLIGGSIAVAIGFLLVTVSVDDAIMNRSLAWAKKLLTCRLACCNRCRGASEHAVAIPTSDVGEADKAAVAGTAVSEEDDEDDNVPLAPPSRAFAPAGHERIASADSGYGADDEL